MRIESKAPTRVDLAGGTLDIWPLYLFHPGAVTVNAAITRYASCRIETQAPGGERRTELRVDLSELERRIVLCYTGKPRKSAINNWDVFRAHINGDKGVFRNLARISEVAQELRGALEASDWTQVGRLMREEWSFRKRNLPTITTKTIDRIVDSARRKGALAGKVCGAGGGGCVVLLIEPETRERVEAAVVDAAGESVAMKMPPLGGHVKCS